MSEERTDPLLRILRASFAIFVVTSSFSIALAQLSLGLSLVLFLTIAVRDRYNPFQPELRTVCLLAGLYVAWLLLASLLGSTPWQSIQICKEEWLFAAIPVGVLLFRDRRYADNVFFALALAVGLVSVYAISQFFTGTHWLHFTQGTFESIPVVRPVGNFAHWLTFADYYAVIGAALVAYVLFDEELTSKRRLLFLIAGLLSILAVVLTASRTPIAAIVVSLLLLSVVRSGATRWLTLGTILVVVALTLALPASRAKFGGLLKRDTSTEYAGSRVFIWTRSLDIVKTYPLFGVGQGNFQKEYAARLEPGTEEFRKLSHAHNDFINIAAISGIPGALFFAGLWIVVLRQIGAIAVNRLLTSTQRKLALAAFVGSIVFLVCSLTEAAFADEEVRQMLMFLWAIGLSVRYNSQT